MYDMIRDSLDDIRMDAAKKEELWERILTEAQSASEETEVNRMNSKKIYKIILIAAAVIVLLTGAALAANLLGLSAITIPDSEIAHPATGDPAVQVSFTKPIESTAEIPEEFADWAARCTALTEARDARMEELFPEDERPLKDGDEIQETAYENGIHTLYNHTTGETMTMTDEEYEQWNTAIVTFGEDWNNARQELLEKLAPEYGLTVRNDDAMHNTPGSGSGAEQEFLNNLASNVCSGELFTGDISFFDKFYWFDGGSFGASYGIDGPSGNRIDTYIRYTPMNEYVSGLEIGYWVSDEDSFEPRSYVTADGTEFTVCKNDTEALAYGYLDGGYCVLDIHKNGETLTEEDVNYALDFLNFTAIGK